MEDNQSTANNFLQHNPLDPHLDPASPASSNLCKQTMPSVFIGIDIAKATFDVCVLLPNAKPKAASPFKQRAKGFDNQSTGFEALHTWLTHLLADGTPLSQVHCAMEATGIYWEALALELGNKGYTVSVVNPSKIASYGQVQLQRGKTDKQDAALIARYCQREQPMAYVPAPKAQRELLLLTRQYGHVQEALVAHRLRLQTCQSVAVAESIQTIIECLQAQLKLMQQTIDAQIEQDPQLKQSAQLLKTIPAVGAKTIPSLLAYLGDGSRFERGKQAAAFAGLSPRQNESGSSIKKPTRTSKMGHQDLRTLLYMPAMGTFGKRRAYLPFIDRLLAAGKRPMQIIVALMRKILTIAFAVLKSKLPFNPLLHAV